MRPPSRQELPSMRRRLLPLLFLALALPAAARASERPWVEITTPHFLVDSNAGEQEGARLGWQFEQVRAVFGTLWPWAHTQSGRRFVVIVVRDEAGLRALAPQYWEHKGGLHPEAVFVDGPDRDY